MPKKLSKGRKFDLANWLDDSAWDRLYWSKVKKRATDLDSDGCSGVPDWFKWSCLEHDVHYRTHRFLSGKPITKEIADYILRIRVQQASGIGIFSPISWIRWLGVRYLSAAKRAWDAAHVIGIGLTFIVLSGCSQPQPDSTTKDTFGNHDMVCYEQTTTIRCLQVKDVPIPSGLEQ